MASGAPAPAGRLTLCGVWQRTAAQFVSDTNLAGVNNAGRARHPLRRVLWSCVWLVGLGVTLNDVISLANKFLAYPVSTDYTIVYDSQVIFPAVTVCNQNSVMCRRLLEALFKTPEDNQLQDLVTRSNCLLLPFARDCTFSHQKFLTFSTVPTLLQNSSCFETTADNCCQVSRLGEEAAMNASWHLAELGCDDSHLRSCTAPGGQDSGQDSGQDAGQDAGQDSGQDSGQDAGQDAGQDSGQDSGQDAGQDAGQESDAQSQQQRRKRSVWKRAAPSMEDVTTPRRSSVAVRRRREAGPSTNKPEPPEMEIDNDHEEKIQFYREFMSMPLATRSDIGQEFASFIRSCTFNGRDCLNSAYFSQTSVPEYGNCFTFNSNISRSLDEDAGKRTVNMMGPDNGLSLVLFLDTSNYMPSQVTQTKGARVAIHPNDVTPMMSEAGLEIGPASLNSISISEKQIVRMPSPYQSNCTSQWLQSGFEPYYVNPTTGNLNASGARYSLAACHRMCLQRRMVVACGCNDPQLPQTFAVEGKLQDIGPPCDLSYNTSDFLCTSKVADAVDKCDCSNPCYESVHQPQLSIASWPQGLYLGNLLSKMDFLNGQQLSYEEAIEQWGSQFAKLNVYFRDLNIAAVTESATYTYTTFISSLGGALSLYLGIALILLLEVVELALFLVYDTVRFLCGHYPDPHHAGPHNVLPASKPAIRVVLSAQPTSKNISFKGDTY